MVGESNDIPPWDEKLTGAFTILQESISDKGDIETAFNSTFDLVTNCGDYNEQQYRAMPQLLQSIRTIEDDKLRYRLLSVTSAYLPRLLKGGKACKAPDLESFEGTLPFWLDFIFEGLRESKDTHVISSLVVGLLAIKGQLELAQLNASLDHDLVCGECNEQLICSNCHNMQAVQQLGNTTIDY